MRGRARELFQESLFDQAVLATAVRSASRIEIVRRRRDDRDQDVSFGVPSVHPVRSSNPKAADKHAAVLASEWPFFPGDRRPSRFRCAVRAGPGRSAVARNSGGPAAEPCDPVRQCGRDYISWIARFKNIIHDELEHGAELRLTRTAKRMRQEFSNISLPKRNSACSPAESNISDMSTRQRK